MPWEDCRNRYRVELECSLVSLQLQSHIGEGSFDLWRRDVFAQHITSLAQVTTTVRQYMAEAAKDRDAIAWELGYDVLSDRYRLHAARSRSVWFWSPRTVRATQPHPPHQGMTLLRTANSVYTMIGQSLAAGVAVKVQSVDSSPTLKGVALFPTLTDRIAFTNRLDRERLPYLTGA